MDQPQIKQMIKDEIKDNLEISIYKDDGDGMVQVEVYYDGDMIAEDYYSVG